MTPLEVVPEPRALSRRELRARQLAEVKAEPVIVEPVILEPTPTPTPTAHAAPVSAPAAATSTAPIVDFDTAARLFSFTGETALPVATRPRRITPVPARAEAAAPTRPSRSKASRSKRSWAASAFSAGVMSIVALMAVSVSAPAEAVAAASDTLAFTILAPPVAPATIKSDEIQAFVAPAEGEVVQLDRDQNYALTTFEQMARESGIHMSTIFVNDANSAIQWPFAVGVGMSYGFGSRSGRMHEGIDFTPGAGAQVQAVAEGTVRIATESGGGYGVHVYIDHVVEGQRLSSHYAHMQYGSLQVVEGQSVVAGDPIGKVGNTGHSFGAHLHFELRVNGTAAIDPLPWLQKYAGGWQG